MNLEGATTLYQLDGFFEAGRRAGSQHDVEMVGHDNKFVEQIVAMVAIIEKSECKDSRYFGNLKNGTALRAFCRNKVGSARGCSMLRCCHLQAFFWG